MRNYLVKCLIAIVALMFSASVFAAGELHIYNWGDYTSPELVEKFEQEYDVKVTLTDYDSNETALAKIRPGGHGFDIVVPTSTHVPIWIEEGLLLETRPDQMDNFQHVMESARNPDFDPGRRYTVPWVWGSTGISVNTAEYDGDINTSKILFDPPESLMGKINVVPEMGDVVHMAIFYEGGDVCTDDKEVLKRVRDLLVAAKASWKSLDYGTKEKLVSGDVAVSMNWNGYSMRARSEKPEVHYGYPIEGYPLWMDNVAVLKDANNVENAKMFQNFLMAPENAALVSNFANYANAIMGSDAYMNEELREAPEVMIPEQFQASGRFIPPCSPEVQSLYTAIWTELQK